jgi:hypothetical protein
VAATLLVSYVVVTAASATPIKAKPKAVVTTAHKVGTNVVVRIHTSFVIPAGKSGAICTGTVTASTKLAPKKTVTLTGSLRAVVPNCLVKLSGKLPVAKYGKTVAFTIAFKGSSKVKPLSFVAKLKLVPPPVPPAPPGGTTPPLPPPPTGQVGVHMQGTWGTDTPTTGPDNRFIFRILADDSIPTISAFGSSYRMSCGPPPDMISATLLNYSHPFTVLVDSATDTFTYVNGNTNITYNVTFTFTGPTTGTGHFSGDGTWDFLGMVGPQHRQMSQDFTMFRTGP